jgi:hypothetical protein
LLEFAADNAPATALVAALSAFEERLINLGMATATRIPMIAMTIVNSISVKPFMLDFSNIVPSLEISKSLEFMITNSVLNEPVPVIEVIL